MKVVFSDLDGTLLHIQSYSGEAALPAVRELRQRNIPLVFCTSKTRAEVELWRERFDNHHPFIVENGGAIWIPQGYFSRPVPDARMRDGYQVIEYGAHYRELASDLREASRDSGCEAIGFSQMSVAEISAMTLLSPQQAALAKLREYDEPFQIIGSGTHNLLLAIEQRGRLWTRGNRFYHITGKNDKRQAVLRLAELYRETFGAVETIGIGDGHNDAGFLGAVDIPIVIRSQFALALKKAVPWSRVTRAAGPYGWNEAVMQLMETAAHANARA
jgi:mannosyl-3-phosphoglycerate phosphatase